MNRVLIITYYWPPSGGSGVQRWLKFAKYLPQFGWEPVIYTPQNPQANAIDEALSKDISPSLEVLKTKIREPYGFYSILSGNKSGKQPIRANLISDNRKSSFFQKFSLYVRGNFFIPDPRRWWVGPSVKYLKNYLREHPVDAIVSTGPPHSMHLIARTLHRETGIRWIADFRDPWTGIFYFKYLPLSRYALRKHRRLEQSVLEEADRIVTVSAQMKEDFSGRTSVPIEIITNGFDPADFAIPETEQNSGNAGGSHTPLRDNDSENDGTTVKKPKFRVVHTGLFTENGNPDCLWEVLGEKAAADTEFRHTLEITVMGQTDPLITEQIRQAGLEENLTDLGYVSHDCAVKWQRSASLLLLPQRKEPEAAGILTGKFFEYLASGVPILAFGPAAGDLADALKETGSGSIYEFGDKTGIRGAVDRAYEEFKTNPDAAAKSSSPKDSRSAERIRKYSRIHLTEKLSGILDELKREK